MAYFESQIYEMPSMRCINYNKPLSHLFDDYKTLIAITSKTDAFELLKLDRPCCRSEINFCFRETIPKLNERAQSTLNSITFIEPIVKIEEPNAPCSYQINTNVKIADNLYISYASDCVYLAQ